MTLPLYVLFPTQPDPADHLAEGGVGCEGGAPRSDTGDYYYLTSDLRRGRLPHQSMRRRGVSDA